MTTIRFDRPALKRLFESEDGPVAKELARRAVKVERAAKHFAPVDTGRLRSSIAWDLRRDERGLAAFIGTDLSYAIYVEFGSATTPARSFLRSALTAAR